MPDLSAPRRLLEDGTLGADLAALLWLLVEARTPLVVAGQAGDEVERVLEALAAFVPADSRVVEIAPDDDFAGLPQAAALGWRPDRERLAPEGTPADRAEAPADDRAAPVLRVRGLAAPGGVTGERALVVVRALAAGCGLLATMEGAGLDDVLEALHDPAVGTGPDERSQLGIVLVLGPGPHAARVVAAHYVRPVAVDPGGHVHRLPPAVLGTWNEARDTWDDFSWGIIPELAARLGMRPLELEREQADRARRLRSGGV